MHSHKINFLFSKWVGKSLGADVLTNRPTDVLSITFLVFCICLFVLFVNYCKYILLTKEIINKLTALIV